MERVYCWYCKKEIKDESNWYKISPPGYDFLDVHPDCIQNAKEYYREAASIELKIYDKNGNLLEGQEKSKKDSEPEDNIPLRERRKLREQNVLITTTYVLQDRNIVKYFDLITYEVVLGTGPLSEISAQVHDLFGTRSGKFEEKLQKAKETAFSSIKRIADEMGANAVIAVKMDYSVMGNNMIVIVISGTPVVVEQNSEE